jgi:hypothetical protein
MAALRVPGNLRPWACSMSPQPPDGSTGPWKGHSPSSALPHDLETAVVPKEGLHRVIRDQVLADAQVLYAA